MKFINRKSDLPQKIAQLTAEGGVSPEACSQIMDAAKDIQKLDEAEKSMLQGLLHGCAASRDIDKMHENFGRALECSPEDAAILRNYGRALFHNGLYSQAISTLQRLDQPDGEDENIMGLCCQALGLTAKARQFLAENASCSCDLPCSSCGDAAIKRVLASFEEDCGIWQSLSTR